MDKGIVILVFISIGLNYGFILPLADLKLDLAKENTNENVETKVSQSTTTSVAGHTKELPSNRSDIDEKYLYEHADAKQNNQSERAFVYINQKYRKPSLHHFFKLAQNGPEFSRSFHLPPPLPQAFIQRRNEPCKSETESVNTYYSGYNVPYKVWDIPAYFLPPPLVYNCNLKDAQHTFNLRGVVYNNNENLRNYNNENNLRRDFIELLKSPLLRPSETIKSKGKYDGIPGVRFTPPYFKSNPYQPTQQTRNEHNPIANILVDERKTDMQKKYGFSSYARPPAFQGKGIIPRFEEPSFDEEVLISDDPSRFHEKQQYEDKLLDQYLRDALGEQVTSKEKEIGKNDCSYRDCVLQPTKTSSSITHQKDFKKLQCKCGQVTKLTEKDLFILKNKSEKREKPFNKTDHILLRPPSDMAYFKDLMSRNSNTKNNNFV